MPLPAQKAYESRAINVMGAHEPETVRLTLRVKRQMKESAAHRNLIGRVVNENCASKLVIPAFLVIPATAGIHLYTTTSRESA